MKKTFLLCAFALGAGIGLSSVAFGDNTACENRCWGSYSSCIANGVAQSICQSALQGCIGRCYPGCHNQVC